jgi:hypothetical protein
LIRLVSIVLALVLALGSVTAGAQDAKREAELTGLYRTAQEHYLAERYTEALPLFEAVARELDSPNARLYVARCLRKIGRLVDAWHAMVAARDAAAARATSEPRFAETAGHAATELAELDGEVGRVQVTLVAAPADVTVEVAGVAVPPDRLAAPIVVAPGAVRVEGRAPGREPVRREVDVPAGTVVEVALEVPKPPPAAVPPAPVPLPPPAPEPSTPSGLGPVRIAGMAVAGVGVVGWVAFAVAGVMANSKFADLEQRCGGQRCTDPDADDDIREGRGLDLVANLGLAVGIAGVVAGSLMIVFGGPSEAAAALRADGIAVRF